MTGPCAQPRAWEEIHGQKLTSSAGVSLLLNTSQPHVPTKARTVFVMVGLLMELGKVQTIPLKLHLLTRWSNKHSLSTMPTTPSRSSAPLATSRWLIQTPTAASNATVMRRKDSWAKMMSITSRTTGDRPWCKCQ